MGGIKLNVHPLFFLFGFYYALTGKVFVFVIYTVTAVVHELGHSFAAAGAGYRLNRITLMPFGAVVRGDIDGLKFSDEIKIALAGPLLNLAIGLLFVAIWWIYPISYAFTDVAAQANFSMAAINLLPVFPLDGGRVLCASLTGAFGKKKADRVCAVTGAAFSALLLALFVYSIFIEINLSILFFALFIIFGTFGKAKENKYIKLYTCASERRLLGGMRVIRHAVSKNTTVKKAMSLMDESFLNEIAVYDGDREIALLRQNEIRRIIEKGDLYAPIRVYLGENR